MSPEVSQDYRMSGLVGAVNGPYSWLHRNNGCKGEVSGTGVHRAGCEDHFLLQVVLLAIVQGLAELLPVSSSAHVVVAEKLMGLDPSSPPNFKYEITSREIPFASRE